MSEFRVIPNDAPSGLATQTPAEQLQRVWGRSRALKFAFVGPAVFLLVVGGTDLVAVSRSQARLQTIAAAAAAVGAEALDPTTSAIARARAATFVDREMRQWRGAPAYAAKYEVVDGAGRPTMRVVLSGHRPSFLANMLPPGGWRMVGDASAASA